MSNENGIPGSSTPTAAAKLGHQIRRVLLLVAVVVGVVAAYWIWERFRTEEFQVTVVVDLDPHEELVGYPYLSNELLERMDLSVRPSFEGPRLRLKPHDDPLTWTFGVSGDDRRSVKNLQTRGFITWRGSDTEGLRIPLSVPDDPDSTPGRYVLRLTISAVQDFYESISSTLFKVRDRSTGAALPGLRLHGLEVRAFDSESPGIYRLEVDASTLLSHVYFQTDSLTFRVKQDTDDRAAERLALSVPLTWFFQKPTAGELRILDVDFVAEDNTLCPRATNLQPTRVRQDRWPDRLVITGEFLDRTLSASLRGRGRNVGCTIVSKTLTRLELAPDSTPTPGHYEVMLESEGCPSTTGGRLQVVSPSTPLRAQALASAELERGSELTLRWRCGSKHGPLVVEVSAPGGSAPWRRLAQVAADTEHYPWPQVDLDPGSYGIRLRPVDSETATASWAFTVTRPSELLVVLHFVDGKKDWRIGRAWVDGNEIAAAEWQATRSHARVRLTRGGHVWVATGKKDDISYKGSLVVEDNHNFESDDFDNIRLDRADSERRD